MTSQMNNYPTNLTDNRWQVIEKHLDVQERKRKYPLRNIVNAINYLLENDSLVQGVDHMSQKSK